MKNALRAKGGAGKDDRKAIAEQLKLGQELRAKVCESAILLARSSSVSQLLVEQHMAENVIFFKGVFCVSRHGA